MNALAQVAARFPLGAPVYHPAGWSGVVTAPPAKGPRTRILSHLAHLAHGGQPVAPGYDSHLAEVNPDVPIVHVSRLCDGRVVGAWFLPWVFETERDEPTPAPLPVPAATVATVERLARTRGKRGGRKH